MNQNFTFQKLIALYANIHQHSFELTKNISINNVTKVQYSILELLFFDEQLTPSQINTCLNLSMPNTSRELKKLEELNYIVKLNDNADKRKLYISLSSEGKDIMKTAFDHIFAQLETSYSHLTEVEWKQLNHAISIFNQTLFRNI